MNRGDRWLLLLPLVLTAVGLVMVYSSSAILGLTQHQDPGYYFSRQIFRTVLGLIVLLIAAKADLKLLERWAPWLLAIAAGLLAIVVAAGHMSNGATRWLKLGFLTLQPTDLGRLAMVVFLAWWLKKNPPGELGFLRGLVMPLGMLGGFCGLILLQPNLSSAGLLLICGFTMLFLSGAKLRHLVIPVGAGVLAVALALATHPYMMGRVSTFLKFVLGGELDARGSGWQLDQSLIAIGSGGILGKGLGAGMQKYLFLPEAHTDFIFSILGEELGFVGATGLLVVLGLLMWRGLRVASRTKEPFAALLAAGLALQFALYALVNLAVATGLAPTTGLPLPFVSYGGSALLANMAAAGLLYRISTINQTEAALAAQRWARVAA